MKLHIAKGLSLPGDAVTQTLVVYGARGMGKTNFGTVLCEELSAAGLRFSYVDPMGHLWGLRHSTDGKGRGIEVLILGGRHGDIPIEPTGGAVVADLVADEEVDCIIDISRRADGKMWGKGERIRFVTDYCKRLYERQGERTRPLMQIIDEAARFVPQMARHGDDQVAACIGAVEQMVEEGRGVGIGVTLITQRSARLSKSVAELAEAMVAFRTVGPNSVEAILDWFGEHIPKERWKDLVEQLRQLPRGHALVVSPGWLHFEGVAEIRMRHTFDSSATPKAGQERRAHGAGAKPDLARYQARMADTIDRAKASDPAALRRRIAELEAVVAIEKKMKTAERERADRAAPKIQRVEVPVLKDGQVKRLEAGIERMAALQDRLAQAQQVVVTEAGSLRAALARARGAPSPAAPRPAAPAPPPRRLPPPPPPPSAGRNGAIAGEEPVGEGGLDRARRAILAVLAQYPEGCAAGKLALLSGYRWSGGFRNALSALRSAGLIVGPNSATMRITDAGTAALGDGYSPLPTGGALVDYWLNHRSLGACERAVLRALLANPEGLAAGDLAKAAGYEWSGGFRNALSNLRTAGLLVGRNSELMRARDMLLDPGGPA